MTVAGSSARGMFPMPAIVLAPGADSNGLASMMADLIRQNLTDRPEKRHVFGDMLGRIALVAADVGVELTIEIDPGRLTIHDGIVGVPHVTIRADSDDIIHFSLMELLPRLALPDPRGATNRRVLRAVRDGRIRIHGALAHLPLVWRLTRVMSVR